MVIERIPAADDYRVVSIIAGDTMDPIQFLRDLSDDDLIALSEQVASDLFVSGAIAVSTGDPADVEVARRIFTGCNLIHDIMTERGLRIEARMYFGRVNRTYQMLTGEAIMSEAEYRTHYPNNI